MDLYGLKYSDFNIRGDHTPPFDEYYMNATGSPEVNAAQKALDDLNKLQSDKIARQSALKVTYDEALRDYQTRREYFNGCSKHSSSGTNNKWWCKGNLEKMSEAWHNTESKDLDRIAVNLKVWGEELDQLAVDLAKLPALIQAKTEEVNRLRDSVYMANMTPEQRTEYQTAQTKAKAEAEAIKKSAETAAEAAAQATMTKAKQRGLLITGGVLLLAAGIISFFVFRKKGVKVPTSPSIK